MKYILKEMTEEEKPRERLKKYGSSSLADYELLAIILKTGIKEKSVIDLSIELMNYFSKINNLEEATINELTKIKGIGEAKALELLAAIELGKRLNNFKNNNQQIKYAKDVYNYISSELINKKQENFVCIFLDNKTRIICHKLISIGSISETNADIKTAIKWAIKYSATGIIFVHNHPSGDPSPSDNDKFMTNIFMKYCLSVDITFVDHIIIGSNSFYSFKKKSIESI